MAAFHCQKPAKTMRDPVWSRVLRSNLPSTVNDRTGDRTGAMPWMIAESRGLVGATVQARHSAASSCAPFTSSSRQWIIVKLQKITHIINCVKREKSKHHVCAHPFPIQVSHWSLPFDFFLQRTCIPNSVPLIRFSVQFLLFSFCSVTSVHYPPCGSQRTDRTGSCRFYHPFPIECTIREETLVNEDCVCCLPACAPVLRLHHFRRPLSGLIQELFFGLLGGLCASDFGGPRIGRMPSKWCAAQLKAY